MTYPQTEAEQADRIESLRAITVKRDATCIGATRAGCRAALQNSDWDVERAMAMLDEWRRHADQLDALYQLASIRADMSEALLLDCQMEVERLRGILK